MKGFVEQMIYLIVIVLALFMLIVFFTYQRGSRGVETKKSVEERGLDEEGTSLVFTLFNNKLPYVEKVYLQVIIDAILEGEYRKEEKYKVFYGKGIGEVNLTEIIPPLMDNYAKGRWELKITTPDGDYTYGGINKDKVIYIYEALIPVPEERSGKITFFLG